MVAEADNHPESLFSEGELYFFSRGLAALGAAGVALQNYPAVVLFFNGLAQGIIPASHWLNVSIQLAAFGTGGLCSGLVNYWMNVELLEGFFQRITGNESYAYQKLNTLWQQLQFFGGIFVFLVTGLLFGLMAFTFAMEGPLATLSIAAGLFVAAIMTIQEIETWLSSYDQTRSVETNLTLWQQCGQWIGYIIAVGNVFALSLLFTLSLAQALMAMQVAAFPALIAGLAIGFTFGAFTEYFFYNYYLSDFCQNFAENWTRMQAIPQAWLGFLSVSINAFVNCALTYAGVELLSGLLVAAHIALPPVAAITALAVFSALFAGSASFILGLAFWIRQSPQTELNPTEEHPMEAQSKQNIEQSAPLKTTNGAVPLTKSGLSLFAANETIKPESDHHQASMACP